MLRLTRHGWCSQVVRLARCGRCSHERWLALSSGTRTSAARSRCTALFDWSARSGITVLSGRRDSLVHTVLAWMTARFSGMVLSDTPARSLLVVLSSHTARSYQTALSIQTARSGVTVLAVITTRSCASVLAVLFGSLRTDGALVAHGSLQNGGALLHVGSLIYDGALPLIGSLCFIGALHPSRLAHSTRCSRSYRLALDHRCPHLMPGSLDPPRCVSGANGSLPCLRRSLEERLTHHLRRSLHHGSLVDVGALVLNGSLHYNGTHCKVGSLAINGALDSLGSLSLFGTHQELWLARCQRNTHSIRLTPDIRHAHTRSAGTYLTP